MAQEDTGLAQRGLLLLTAMTALVAVVLWIMFQRPAQELPAEASRSEAIVPAVVMPDAGFPGAVAWPVLYQLADDLPSPAGWEVRYNAANTLTRRGSDRVPWP